MGKHKYIETPEKLWELFEAYRKEVKANPRIRYVFVGKDGEEKKERLETPLTLEGFYNYCRREICTVHQYFENQEKAYTDYLGICRAIREEIRQDQIEGGMVGQYSTSITQRLNGLKEQSESTVTNVDLMNLDPLSE